MLTPLYLVLAAVIYGFLADRTDRALEREMRARRSDTGDLRLVEDFDARPDLGPRYGRLLGRHGEPHEPSRSRSLQSGQPND